MLNSLGGLLANSPSQGAYQALAQQQYGVTTATAAAGTLTLLPSYAFDLNGHYILPTPPTKPRERTHLDWLDERVNEMRVRL